MRGLRRQLRLEALRARSGHGLADQRPGRGEPRRPGRAARGEAPAERSAEYADLERQFGRLAQEREVGFSVETPAIAVAADPTRLRQVLGWSPEISLEDGLSRTYAWIEQQVRNQRAG